jgi:hypothetical protein
MGEGALERAKCNITKYGAPPFLHLVRLCHLEHRADLSLPPSHVNNLYPCLNIHSAGIPHNTSTHHADIPCTVDIASGRRHISSNLNR